MIKNELFKKANSKTNFTPLQLQELTRCSKDPIYFIKKYIKIQHPVNGAIPFKLYPFQEKLIKSYQKNKFVILLSARQTGKSVTTAAFIVWYSCFYFDKTILVASNKNSNAMEIMQKIIYGYEELPMWLKPGAKYGTKHSIEFDNGTRVFSQATTENTGRGLALSKLFLDELAFVPKRIQEEMWGSIAPTLATGGSCIIASTPNGDSELFATLLRGSKLGTNDFINFEVKWDEPPDRNEEFKNNMIGKIGKSRWSQEFECQMISSDPLLISSLKAQQIKTYSPLFEKNGINFWGNIDPKCTYYVGIDIGTGMELDFSTIEVLEFPSMKQIAEFRSNKLDIQKFYAKSKWLLNYISMNSEPEQGQEKSELYWSFENNGVGAAFVTLYNNDESFPDAYLLSDEKRTGFVTTGKNKILSCLELKNLVEKTQGGIKINSDVLLTELKNYINSGKSYAARAGSTDDLISAILIVIRLLQKTAEYEPEVFNTIYNYDEYYNEENSDDPYDNDPLPMVF